MELNNCPVDEMMWGDEWGGEWGMGPSACLQVLQEFMRRGRAWNKDRCSWMSRLLDALGQEFCRFSADATQFLEVESDPSQTTWLLEAWEKFLKLPDDCFLPQTVQERRAAIVAKLVFRNLPSPENYKLIAKQLGYDWVIFEKYGSVGFHAGSPAGYPLGVPSNGKKWIVKLPNGLYNEAIICLFNQYKLKHIKYFFQFI